MSAETKPDIVEKPWIGTARNVTRVVATLAMVAIGVAHFANPEPFLRIMPPFLPAPLVLVYVSGAAEVLLGIGLWPRLTRKWAAFGLVALYVAVFPANIYMAIAGIQLDPANPMPEWIAWVRLPFQFLFIAIALWLRR